jgi:beta-lactam-binding protein with PASTA domain
MKLYKTLLFFFLTNLAIYLYGNPIVQKKVAVPHLVGMTVAEAKKVLHSKGLDLGAIITLLPNDSENLDEQTVYKQTPSPRNNKGVQNYIVKGKVIDLWVDKQSTVDTLKKPVQGTSVVIKKNSQ